MILGEIEPPWSGGGTRDSLRGEERNPLAAYTETYKTLAQFSNVSQSPYVWARGGVDVSIWNVELLNSTLVFVRDSGKLAGNAQLAVKDCVKNIAVALIRIQGSLQVLRKINSGHFEDELGVVTRSLRSAIRDEDTCTGKISKAGHGEVLDGVASVVVTATRMTNNALALNNYLAKVGMSHPLN
ncbi:hypothetical protein V2J09_002221 [Rumex salicifolius]